METFNILGKGQGEHTYDAIVVGSGITGGIAALELCRAGLKVLVLERGPMVEHIKDYPTAELNPWDFEHRNLKTEEDKKRQPIQSTLYLYGEDSKHFVVNDTDHPYIQKKPFTWYRGYQAGGRSLLWSKHTFRLSDLDFEANLKEGVGIDWPIRYKDIAPWYDHVEQYIGVSGSCDGLPQLPDGKYQKPFEMNVFEKHVVKSVKERYKERQMIIGRMAVLTEDKETRAKCQGRNLCHRGCTFGAAYSSNSGALPDAAKTGNLTIRPFSTVSTLIYDSETRKVKGVNVIDTETKETEEFFAKVVFLNGSTFNSTQILMRTKTEEYPDGLGNTSGVLGHYLMDHHGGNGASGSYSGFLDSYYQGQKPASVCLPRFRNVNGNTQDYTRGFCFEFYTSRQDWTRGFYGPGIGGDWKDGLAKPGIWTAYTESYGETLPQYDNKIELDEAQKDQWGLPLLSISMEYGENELKMQKDMEQCAREIMEAAGIENISTFGGNPPPGIVIHEMGTARMGRDPKTSFLNGFNQSHEVSNLFVTDGSCMPSSPCQNPSLTYMALTARACNYAVGQLKKGNI